MVVKVSRWPPAADIRIKTYMHDHNLYDAEAPDIKIIPLMRALRRGTAIEECDGHLANTFKQKTIERIKYLADGMLKKGLLENDPKERNSLKKIDLFKSLWSSRHGKYGPTVNATKPVAAAKSRDVYSTDNLPPDPLPKAPVANMVFKSPQVSSTALVCKILYYPNLIPTTLMDSYLQLHSQQ
ncbi:hypothetical protein L207DRAFT_226033 [Hyaloscypha variabilis F]|uniref:Uncharacterized protein n=1 Tax=Hyaloscypha variabilis (strain UAMH 11265 / GT02V1 / F) TaxID=1149755 RepID=A0A2J6QVW6_HYAVF|nr:hypothetical protein L207DRAFT_226033 [Hyaloscypha variabilis F]